MKYEAIRTHSQEFAVGKMCKALGLTRGAYYQWIKRTEAKEENQRVEQKIVNRLIEVFEEKRGGHMVPHALFAFFDAVRFCHILRFLHYGDHYDRKGVICRWVAYRMG